MKQTIYLDLLHVMNNLLEKIYQKNDVHNFNLLI